MSVPVLPGGFGAWFGAALLCWLIATAAGLARRHSNSPLLALLVGTGSALAFVAALAAGDAAVTLPLPWYLGAAGFQLVADPLSRWFLAIIGLVGMAVALFAPGYLAHLRKRVALGFVWAALAALLASMTGVVLAGNAIFFLVAWEVMALSSFALVAADHAQHSVRHAALVYLAATRAGTALLMAGFLWAHQLTGSWEFAAWTLSGRVALGPALLIFLGLATKAGCWPFHLWLPIAHPAAPAPVSALMSGVMIKTAIYAMARLFTGNHLDAPGLATVVLLLGAVSAFWGVLFALLQHDLKRLLAYHSVENIGIILMGLGLAMTGQQLRLPLLAGLGLAAALFHSLNHALFKSLLFLGAGAVDARAHTRDVEHLGGLIHRMPWTAACFIAGSAAICALPPLNGFASEWLLYRAFFELGRSAESVGLRAAGLLLMGWLALVGALALACFVKAAGVVFLGQPRSREAARAREASGSMVAAQVGLALTCAALGLGAGAVLAPLSRLAAGPAAAPGVAATWVLPLPLLTLLLAGTILLVGAWMAALSRALPTRRYITWECGFGDLGPRTQYTATSFAQPIVRLFGAVYRYRLEVTVAGRDRRHFPQSVTVTPTHEPYLETRVYGPLVRMFQRAAGTFVMRLQAGSIHQYLVYIILALGLLLWLGYRCMTLLLVLLASLVNLAVVPLLLVGVIRKVKARMQNRLGAPLLQPFYDAAKLLRKGETVSQTASWIFTWTPRVSLAVALAVALLVPWSGLSIADWGIAIPTKPQSAIRNPQFAASDLLLVIYLLGLGKFLAMLAAMDTGSAFGGLGASREATLSLLAEPILVMGLSALALGAGTTNLVVIYALPMSPFVAALAGGALVIAALAELSRMPVDDPTTHLELTMVHEAMILENSGRNLALTELAVALRTAVLLGLPAQTLLRIWPAFLTLPWPARCGLGLGALFAAGALLAVAEGVLVKLNWRRVPNFLAFGTALSLLAVLVAAARG